MGGRSSPREEATRYLRDGRCLGGGKEESGVKVGMCSQDYVMIGAVRAHVDDKKGAKYGVPTS